MMEIGPVHVNSGQVTNHVMGICFVTLSCLMMQNEHEPESYRLFIREVKLEGDNHIFIFDARDYDIEGMFKGCGYDIRSLVNRLNSMIDEGGY